MSTFILGFIIGAIVVVGAAIWFVFRHPGDWK